MTYVDTVRELLDPEKVVLPTWAVVELLDIARRADEATTKSELGAIIHDNAVALRWVKSPKIRKTLEELDKTIREATLDHHYLDNMIFSCNAYNNTLTKQERDKLQELADNADKAETYREKYGVSLQVQEVFYNTCSELVQELCRELIDGMNEMLGDGEDELEL